MNEIEEREAEEAARSWWADLQERSLGTTHIQEWGYLWVSVMLRRVAAKHPGPGLEHRNLANWQKLIQGEIEAGDRWPDGSTVLDVTLWDPVRHFFHAKGSPWFVEYHRDENKFSVRLVASLDEDIEYARKVQRHRMTEEKCWRDWADRKRADLQREAGRPQLAERAALLRELRAHQPEDQDTINENYMLGFAARPGNEPFDASRDREWRRGWLESDQHIEECDVAEHLLNQTMKQMADLSYVPAEVIARVLDFFGVELDHELIDEITEHQGDEREPVARDDGFSQGATGSDLIH
jgi:hypothetical protein